MFSEASVCWGYDVTSCLVPCSFQEVLCHFQSGPMSLSGESVSRGGVCLQWGVGTPLVLTSSGGHCSDRYACLLECILVFPVIK